MYRLKFSLGIISLIIIFLTACSYNQFSNYRPIQALSLIDSISISSLADKISYSPIDRTFYLLERETNSIRLYKNGSYFNIIGGSGFSNENFRRLVDICIGIDGSIYALDSFDQSIKRFDKDGIFMNQSQIHNISSPERFAITNSGTMFIYDSHSKEVFVLDAFDLSVKFTFGKFQIDRADTFFIAGDYLNIFDMETRETTVFLINGMFENSFRSFTIFDGHRNLLSLSYNSIVASAVDRMVFNTNYNMALFNIERDYFIIGLSQPGNSLINEIQVYRGIYEAR